MDKTSKHARPCPQLFSAIPDPTTKNPADHVTAGGRGERRGRKEGREIRGRGEGEGKREKRREGRRGRNRREGWGKEMANTEESTFMKTLKPHTPRLSNRNQRIPPSLISIKASLAPNKSEQMPYVLITLLHMHAEWCISASGQNQLTPHTPPCPNTIYYFKTHTNGHRPHQIP